MVSIVRSRWTYLGHTLREDPQSPQQLAMDFYMSKEEIQTKRFGGTKRVSIVTTIQREIRETIE